MVIAALATTFFAASSLAAFVQRLVGPPSWQVTPAGFAATRPGNLLPKRFRFSRSEIVTVRSDNWNLHVITQQDGRWRAASFPILTTGGDWLAELIGTTLGLSPLPHQYIMTRVPDDTAPDQLTYGLEGAGPRDRVGSAGIPAVAPEGEPPADAQFRVRRDGDAWTVTRPPPEWFRRIAVWTLLGGIAVLFVYYMVVRSADGLGLAFCLVLLGPFISPPVRDRFARTCGPTVLAFDDDTLQLTRPTGWGTRRQTMHWWMIGSISLRHRVRRGRPCADLRLHTKTGRVVPLFQSLPERDARWVAAMVAGSLAMDEAVATWTPPDFWTRGPR